MSSVGHLIINLSLCSLGQDKKNILAHDYVPHTLQVCV